MFATQKNQKNSSVYSAKTIFGNENKRAPVVSSAVMVRKSGDISNNDDYSSVTPKSARLAVSTPT